jgi:hypothetical protein
MANKINGSKKEGSDQLPPPWNKLNFELVQFESAIDWGGFAISSIDAW